MFLSAVSPSSRRVDFCCCYLPLLRRYRRLVSSVRFHRRPLLILPWYRRLVSQFVSIDVLFFFLLGTTTIISIVIFFFFLSIDGLLLLFVSLDVLFFFLLGTTTIIVVVIVGLFCVLLCTTATSFCYTTTTITTTTTTIPFEIVVSSSSRSSSLLLLNSIRRTTIGDWIPSCKFFKRIFFNIYHELQLGR